MSDIGPELALGLGRHFRKERLAFRITAVQRIDDALTLEEGEAIILRWDQQITECPARPERKSWFVDKTPFLHVSSIEGRGRVLSEK